MIAGTVVDGANTALRPLAQEVPRPEPILRVLFRNVKLADPTELVCTEGFGTILVLVRAVNTPPSANTTVAVRGFTGPDEGGDPAGTLATNSTRHDACELLSSGAWVPGYLIDVLPRFVQFAPLNATVDVDLLIELRRQGPVDPSGRLLLPL